MTKYGRSPWLDRFPRSRVPAYPRQKGSLDTDVVVVGGGLTGCATAYAMAAAGVKVALLESDQIGRAGAASTLGWIGEDPGPSLGATAAALGMRAARHAWHAWHRAALDFAALLRRLDVKCGLAPQGALFIAVTADEATRLRREQKSRREAGVESSLLGARVVGRETGLAAAAALRSREGALIDPYRAAIGLAAAAESRGARLFERSTVVRVVSANGAVEARTEDGVVRARRVVIATGGPTALFKSLARHFAVKSSFAALTEPVPARVRRQLGERTSILHDSAAPPHVVRWVDDERLLVAGADAGPVPPRRREKTIVQRTGQLMYELSMLYPEISGIMPAYGWDLPYAATGDGLPFIGPHRNYPRHLFALGGSGQSVTASYLASRILLRYHVDAADRADEVYAFARV
jgi:glycine/D-amino acid oxidase-like deaminating enzyme